MSGDGGRSYPRGRERALPDRPPDQPAAVRIFDEHGYARCLPADLDSSRGGPDQVARDLARLKSLLSRCGGQVITDRSPNGGMHLYVPWQQPVPFTELRPVMQALATLLPTLDIQPTVNVLSGCLRPPGSRHRTGGWQELTTPLPDARAIAAAGNPPRVWANLRALLLPHGTELSSTAARPTDQPALRPRADQPLDLALPGAAAGGAGPHERQAHLERLPLPRRRALSADTLHIAQHGVYDPARYATPSQARQRVVAAAAGAGWSYAELLEQLHAGHWPGLASFYSRYRSRHRVERLAADWNGAITWIRSRQPAPATKQKRAYNSHTREPTTHGGEPDSRQAPASTTASQSPRTRESSGEYQYVRTWWNAALRLERSRYVGRQGLTRRLLLRALANAAQKKGSRYLEFGCRSLSLAMGVDHSTAAAALRALRSEPDPLLVLLENRRGVRGDLYELTVPDEVQDSIDRRPWKAGSIQAIHPAFRALGLPVAFVYEQLVAGPPQTSLDLAERALVSHRAAQQALKTLSTHGLATRTPTGWLRGARTLDCVARELGVDEVLEEIKLRHRRQRQTWRALLGAYLSPSATPVSVGQAQPQPTGDGVPADQAPPAQRETPMQLLYRVLGAVPIPPEEAGRQPAGRPAPVTGASRTHQAEGNPDASASGSYTAGLIGPGREGPGPPDSA